MNEWMDGLMNGLMEEWMVDEWMMEEWIYILYFSVVAVSFLYVRERY